MQPLARPYLFLWLKFPLGLPLTWANSIGSGETARMHRLAWTSAVRICFNGSFPMTRLIKFLKQNLSINFGWNWIRFLSFHVAHDVEFWISFGLFLIRTACWEVSTYHAMGKFSRRQTDDIFFLFLLENRIWHFMQIVSPQETIWMKCQILFIRKNKKNLSKYIQLQLLPSMKSVRIQKQKCKYHTVVVWINGCDLSGQTGM